MKIGIGNDHHGLLEKKIIIDYLEKNNIEYVNFGTDTKDSVDYIDYAEKVSKALINNEIQKGILICGTGIGMSIAANKFKGIRCARVINAEEAKMAREHNNANVIAIPEDIEDVRLEGILEAFINTPFSNEERHRRRVERLNNLQ